MSDLDNAINSINASAAKAENTSTFLDDMSTFDDQSSVTNPNNGQTVASISKQIKDRTDELFTAAESDINQAVSDAAQSATDAQDAADSIGRYQGLWADTGGSADKGDTYQTQVSGTPTGQYFTALQNTTVDPVGDDVNWRALVGFSDINEIFIDKEFSYSVGAAGDYSSINQAILSLSKKVASYIDPTTYNLNASPIFKIKLLSGYVMAEQVLSQGVDLGWLVIESEDAETTIDRQALTISMSGRFPAFGARNGGTLPVIGAKFVMNETGDSEYRDGVFATNGANVNILTGCGVRNSGARGLHISNNSRCNARGSEFHQSKDANFRSANGSWCSVRDSLFDNSGSNAMQISSGSIIDASGVNCNNAQYCGLFSQASFINIQDSSFDYCQKAATNAGYDGAVHVIQGSHVHASGSTAIGSKRRAFENRDSTLILYDEVPSRTCDGSNAEAEGLFIVAGITVATEIKLDDCGSWGIDSLNSGSLDAENASLQRCGDKVSNTGSLRVRSGIANLRSSNGADAVGRAAFIDRGAVVNLSDATYTNSDTGLSIQGASTVNGISLNVSGASSDGVSVNNGSRLSFNSGNAVRSGSPGGNDINCSNGSTITAHSAQGTISKIANTLDSNGIIYNNEVAKNKGRISILSGTSSIQVAHGVSYPLEREDIMVTPNSDLGSLTFFVTIVDDSNFEIELSGTAPSNLTFSWVAEKW